MTTSNGVNEVVKPDASQLSAEQKAVIARIQTRLIQLGAEAQLVPYVSVGPVVSVYRMVPTGGTTVARLEGYEDDLSVALSSDVIVKRVPGEGYVGVYVPNTTRSEVQWRDVIKDGWREMNQLGVGRKRSMDIPLLFGIDFLGRPYIEDLTLAPHLLVAGSTGGGKSVFLKSLIATIVYTLNSRDLGIWLSDTKQVEFTHLKDLPHLMDGIATDAIQTMGYMDQMSTIVESRLQDFGRQGVANIQEYNLKAEASGQERLRFLILVIDELADILTIPGSKRGEAKMGTAKLDRIVRRARAAGCHVIAATQRPSVDVVAGVIKANFPARLTFRLPQGSDSMTVLGTVGAEHLLTRGDMLYSSPNKTGLVRLHAPWTSLDDIKGCVAAARAKEGM